MPLSLHVFDPQESCISGMQASLGYNDSVTLNQLAVGKSNEAMSLYLSTEQDPHASLVAPSGCSNGTCLKQEQIQCTRLDSYIQEKGVQHIDLLKLDVEGNELEALLGLGEFLNTDFVDCIQFEYGGCHSSVTVPFLSEFYSLLQKNGFTLCKLYKSGPKVLHYKPWLENFNYANYVAVAPALLS